MMKLEMSPNRLLYSILVLILVFQPWVDALGQQRCSRAEAKNAVNTICKLIEKKGTSAKPEIFKYRYCGYNYVWVQSFKEKTIIVHPVAQYLNGSHIDKIVTPSGIKIAKLAQNKAKSSPTGGWIEYSWPKPSVSAKPEAKVAFVKLCPGPLQWLAGSGVWKIDIN